ncbi:hypothetical protein DBB36_23440, partial [Flavobacterium sp. WLB]|uniref:glycosyltransferase n=2 Tax=Flavobacterium TaxID=237 RepID=UPI000DE61D43
FSFNEEVNQKGDYFIAVNSLNPRKNIQVILEAFKTLDLHQFKLKIIGGSFNTIFKNDLLGSDSLNVEFLNDISDVELKKEMEGAKALINGSFYEGFGLSALEAMSVSTPCILSNIPVYKELYNETALFFDPGKPLELVQKIKDLIDLENYTDLCKKSFELSQKFNWEITSQRYISIIENLKKTK